MPAAPILLIRRWPERRPVVLAGAAGFAAVALSGEPDGRRAAAGDGQGPGTVFGIVVRGGAAGLDRAGSRSPSREDRVALELLADQAGLAADNQRLLALEREAAATQAELRLARDDLLEQRAGLGHLLDSQEDDRRRHAETLHEQLAQVLAGVLMQLRSRRSVDGSLGDLHDEVRGVLAELRDVATELRPSSLAQLGLVPALESIDGLTVLADSVPDPVPEPLRTGIFRLVEQVVSAATADAGVRLHGNGDQLDVTIDAELTDLEPVAAARACRIARWNARQRDTARPRHSSAGPAADAASPAPMSTEAAADARSSRALSCG